MTHVRAALRAAVAETLGGLAETGGNVFRSRLRNLPASALPALKIYTPREASARRTQGAAGELARSVEVIVEIVAAANEGVDDLLDAIAADVENALAEDPTLGGLCAALDLETTNFAPDREGETDVGVLSLAFRAELESAAADARENRALASGRFAKVAANGAPVARLIRFSIDVAAELDESGHADSVWAEYVAHSARPAWTASVALVPDPDDPGQAELAAVGALAALVFSPRGGAAGARAGQGVVTGLEESTNEEGEIVRVVTIAGDGPLA